MPGLKADLDRFKKTIKEAVEIESKGKTPVELEKEIEKLEATNETVTEAQKQELIRRTLKEAEQ